MTTIKLAVLRHTRAKDGSYKIRISIGHQSETSYIVTKYRVTSFSNFSNGQVVGQPDANAINLKLRKLLNDYDARLERIPNPSDYTCTQLRDLIENMSDTTNSITLRAKCEDYCSRLRGEGRSSYAKIIEYHIKNFLAYTHGDIFLSEITPLLVDRYNNHLLTNGASHKYASMFLVSLRTLVNHAIKMQQVRYDVHPFLYWHAQKGEPRDNDITVDETRQLFAYHPKFRGMRRAIDLFRLSYYLGGINLIDMLAYDFRDYKTQPLSYVRHKTRNKKASNRTIQFAIIPEAYPIIEKYMDKKTGKLDVHFKGEYRTFLVSVDVSLKRCAELLNLPCAQKISYYSARKSFVQHGFDLGIPLETLEYCIGQSMKSNRPIFNYVKIMSRHADEAIRKIVDNINGSPSITDKEPTK